VLFCEQLDLIMVRKSIPHRQRDSTGHRPIIRTSYTSKPVKIPPYFLVSSPSDADSIIAEKIHFAASPLPEYAGMYATVLDNVLSASECAELLRLAEVSSSGWQPELVNAYAGIGREVSAPEIRSCERIMWDSVEMVKRIWDRCLLASGLEEDLQVLDDQEIITGKQALGYKWKMTRLNERMRFLKYGSGQYFRSMCQLSA
jgi:hypothetical protein